MPKPRTSKAKPKRLKKFKAFKSVKAAFNSAIRKANKKRPPSSIELLVYSWLEEDGVKFKKEKAIGRCHADIFLEPDILLELQGCYFHRCTKCKPNQTGADLAIRLKDAKRFLFFQSKGYTVIEIWEHDIVKNPDKVRAILRKLYRMLYN